MLDNQAFRWRLLLVRWAPQSSAFVFTRLAFSILVIIFVQLFSPLGASTSTPGWWHPLVVSKHFEFCLLRICCNAEVFSYNSSYIKKYFFESVFTYSKAGIGAKASEQMVKFSHQLHIVTCRCTCSISAEFKLSDAPRSFSWAFIDLEENTCHNYRIAILLFAFSGVSFEGHFGEKSGDNAERVEIVL